jgi:hypothetical protein
VTDQGKPSSHIVIAITNPHIAHTIGTAKTTIRKNTGQRSRKTFTKVQTTTAAQTAMEA